MYSKKRNLPPGHGLKIIRVIERGIQSMLISEENLKAKNRILGFEKMIDEMHIDFQKYQRGVETKRPDWERLERDLIVFSRKKVYDLELSKQLDRVLFKFQNRKKIWLKWIEEFHKASSHQ